MFHAGVGYSRQRPVRSVFGFIDSFKKRVEREYGLLNIAFIL